jgi:EAL domain-containing protein (putative c-di-GMP-specific phosphodiesterase class I)/GGDEF domain-containing protein/DNA-dependent RNA polymerase auxiliary subunit epsilon
MIIKQGNFWSRVLFCAAILLLLLVEMAEVNKTVASSGLNDDEINQRENVLIVHSYNQGFSWTDELQRGIREKLADKKYNIYTEYLDAYRNNPLDYNKIETIKGYSTKDIDYIVVTDNTAFELILSLKEAYFSHTPVLFAGVNGGVPADMKFQDVKGILQNVDYKEFLWWLNRGMPQIKDLLVCGADTSTSEGTYDQIMAAYAELGERTLNYKIHFIKISDYDQQLDEIKSYDKLTTAIYSAGAFGVLNHEQFTDMLSSNSQMPIFCGVSTSITNQVIGGFVVSPYEHGLIIGKEINDLSNGQAIESLPIIDRPIQQKIFNYNGLVRFNLTEADLPTGSTIINKPQESFVLTITQLIMIIATVSLLIVVISALLIILRIRQKGNDALSLANCQLVQSKMELEEKSRKLLESQNELTHNYDLLVGANQKISNLLDYHQLTGVLNELKFADRLETDFGKEKDVTIINITITNLNILTYSHGKEIYGAILKSIANFLREITRESDLVGLSSNNDFLIATEGIQSENSDLVEKITLYFEKPLLLELFTVIIKYKIGIAYYPLQTDSFKKLLRYSRLAITPIIDNMLVNVSVFKPSVLEMLLQENCIKNEIETALIKGEFILFYQPKYATDGQTILGLEALIRWNHQDGTQKAPAYFIDIAEQSGQIINIGFYVIESVCQAIVEYRLAARKIPTAINLSGGHFASKDIIYKLTEAVNRYKIPPQFLEIEITETALIQNKEICAAILTELRKLGFTITLDDFGTGYSSIDYIKNLPIDKLKIDQSYVNRLEDIKAQKLLKTMIQMAHELSLEVTVEGVETLEQYQLIKALEPDELQGYFFKRPALLTEIFKN